jgi:hypothetical protein
MENWWWTAAFLASGGGLGAFTLAVGALSVAVAYWAVTVIALAYTWLVMPREKQGRHRRVAPEYGKPSPLTGNGQRGGGVAVVNNRQHRA